MTANQKYQKDRAKEQPKRIRKPIIFAWYVFKSDNAYTHPHIQHKRLQLI